MLLSAGLCPSAQGRAETLPACDCGKAHRDPQGRGGDAARTHRLPRSELFELLYIEAWIALQEGDEPLAERNLRSIVNETPRSAIARKSEKVLESLKGDAK